MNKLTIQKPIVKMIAKSEIDTYQKTSMILQFECLLI
jgi:hypothetical protein